MTPILSVGDASAYLLRGVGRGGRVHYQHASDCLSQATGRAVVVAQRPSGRARLTGAEPELGVSLSYRDGALLVGYSPAATVGVDIEPDDETLDPAQLARDHFAAAEAALVDAAPTPAARRNLFLRLWTAKEAVLKATGRGVYDGLDEPDLSRMFFEFGEITPFIFAPGSRHPAGRVIAGIFARDDAPNLYVALARLD